MSLNRITGRSSAGLTPASIFARFGELWRTIAGYEAIHMIRKRQACEGAPGERVVLMHCFILGLFSEVAV